MQLSLCQSIDLDIGKGSSSLGKRDVNASQHLKSGSVAQEHPPLQLQLALASARSRAAYNIEFYCLKQI